MAPFHVFGLLLALAQPKTDQGLAIAATLEADLGVTSLRQGDLEMAKHCANQSLLWEPTQATAHAIMAYVLAEQDELDQAGIEAQKALKIAPESSYSHTARALCLSKQGRTDEAKAECEEALKRWPEDPLAYLLKGDLQPRNSADAADAYLNAIKADPKVSRAHAALGALYAAKNSNIWADRELTIATTLQPEIGVWQLQLGEVQLKVNKPNGALEHLSKALELTNLNLAPQHTDYLRIQLGRLSVFQALNQYDKAEATAQETLAMEASFPDSTENPSEMGQLHDQLGDVYYAEHKWEDAIGQYETARSNSVLNSIYTLNEAYADLNLDRLSAASDLAMGVKGFSPNTPEVYDILGSVAYAQDQWAEAAGDYRKAVELSPGTAAFHAKLATAYANQKQFDQAELESRKAFELSAKSPFCFNSLAIVFFEKQDYAAALPLFQIASSLAPESSVIHANLAGCYLRLKQSAQAHEEGQKAYDLGLRHHWVLKELGLLAS